MVDGVFNGRHFSPSGRPAALSLCSPLPANPCSSVSGSKIFTFPSPDFSLTAVRRRPLFATRKPLQLRFGEQNLHIPAAGFRPLCRPAAPSLCSPFPANPCSSVPGSKIFTFPPPNLSLQGGRRLLFFAPRSPLALVVPFRGAKSSHSHPRSRGRFSVGRRPQKYPVRRSGRSACWP